MSDDEQLGGRRASPSRHPVARAAWLVVGFVFVALGIIGALLPIMPTTIFLIVATGCFARSSPRFETWLLNHRHFGPPLRAWRENRSVSRHGKIAACTGMAMGFGLFCLTVRPGPLPALGAAAFLLASAAYVVTRPAPLTAIDRRAGRE